ncbi:hypothetical protein [Haloarchaeobius sp. HRN-SO-5]|uniref:hypothetical protein n=1 Tax=Haloarchaeobius sp. HRN-SO-5 TaxID=3446118 RepID=UPI003EBE78F2
MIPLDPGFESQLREAVLDDAQHEYVGKQNNLVFQTVEEAHSILREYGQAFDYDVEPIIESFGPVEVDRTDQRLTVRWGWEHPASVYMEFGTSDHTVDGEPVLSFVWSREDAPDWVAREFEPEGDGYRVFLPEVDVRGLPESRYVRRSLHWLRREAQR